MNRRDDIAWVKALRKPLIESFRPIIAGGLNEGSLDPCGSYISGSVADLGPPS
ncbi:unnamed protein product, partial [Nippostrongylus brasiliensis]|uniref:Transposase n=1 Tax=Nippostrongylus brasiliensis TaxID=27835 RepID=A0A0N4XG77_NIPBR